MADDKSKSDKWISDYVTYLRGHTSPTEAQSLIVLLSDKPKAERTARDDKTLTVLLAAEKQAQKAVESRKEAARFLQTAATERKKERDHLLITKGALIETAGMLDRTAGELLGLLMAGKKSPPENWQKWKESGDAELLAREAAKKAAKAKGG